MDVKTKNVSGWADQAAKVAHETIERMREQVTSMECDVADKATTSVENMGSAVTGRVKAIGEFIEANPVQAALVAFGVGLWASRVFKGTGFMAEQTGPEPMVTPRAKAKVMGTRKAA